MKIKTGLQIYIALSLHTYGGSDRPGATFDVVKATTASGTRTVLANGSFVPLMTQHKVWPSFAIRSSQAIDKFMPDATDFLPQALDIVGDLLVFAANKAGLKLQEG